MTCLPLGRGQLSAYETRELVQCPPGITISYSVIQLPAVHSSAPANSVSPRQSIRQAAFLGPGRAGPSGARATSTDVVGCNRMNIVSFALRRPLSLIVAVVAIILAAL